MDVYDDGTVFCGHDNDSFLYEPPILFRISYRMLCVYSISFKKNKSDSESHFSFYSVMWSKIIRILISAVEESFMLLPSSQCRELSIPDI